MNGQVRVKRQKIAKDVTSGEIERLIDQKKRAGAISCEVQVKGGEKLLVCKWPPL